jgi:hypothetical protein
MSWASCVDLYSNGVADAFADGFSESGLDGNHVCASTDGEHRSLESVLVDRAADLDRVAGAKDRGGAIDDNTSPAAIAIGHDLGDETNVEFVGCGIRHSGHLSELDGTVQIDYQDELISPVP